MKIQLIPLKIQAFGDDEPIFNMEMLDEYTATIEISGWIDKDNWPHIQKGVADALEMMFPEGL